METKTVQEIHQKRQADNIPLLDVRTPAEFREAHAEGAVNLPLDQVSPQTFTEALPGADGKPVAVICGSGKRSAMAIQKLETSGIQQLINVEGGTQAWIAAQLPHQTGKTVMSLERQVRISAGTIIVLGCVLGAFLHPGYYFMALFIGAGFIFSGLTDTCGMGMILAKMPWNR
ncbi:MAG: rhodanese-like domain-containing protein [Verrucomicrobiota bacterium]